MKITRVIHPIGQGGFYTETLSSGSQTINVVYDCGGFDKNGQRKMKRYLDSYLKGPEKKTVKGFKKNIEAVFVSHFHADHINGLQYLLENANVRYLVIPQLTEESVAEAMVYNFCLTGTHNLINQFLVRLYGRINSDNENEEWPKIIQVDDRGDNRIPGAFTPDFGDNDDISLKAWNLIDNKQIDISALKNRLPFGTIFHCGKWLYIPFNSIVANVGEKRKELMQKLKDEFGGNFTIKELPGLLKKIRVKECKKIYKEIFGDKHNSYSMTLFSGTVNGHSYSRIHCKMFHECDEFCHCHPRTYHYCCNPNFLYTGDFEPKGNVGALKVYYSPLWNKIASIQVPHHGSKDNFDEALYENPVRGIISVGNGNTYHHPNVDVLMKMYDQSCKPIVVTEDKSSIKIYQYEV